MIKTWRDRVPDNLNLYRTCVTYPQQLMQAEIDELRAAIATARKDERERLVQICLLERDKADKREPDPPGSTVNRDHLMGQGCMANLLAKKFRNLTDEG